MPTAVAKARKGSARPAAQDVFEGSLTHRLLLGLVALKVFALIVVFDPAGLEAFEIVKAQVGRALAWPMAVAIVLALWQFGTGVIPRSRMHAFVGLYLLAVAASAAFAEVPYLAIHGERGNYFGLVFFLDMAILYFAACIAIRGLQDARIIAAAIVLGAGVTVGYSVVQFVGLDPVAWPVDVSRPIGTFGSTVRHGHFLAIVFATAVAIAVLLTDPAHRRIRLAAAFVGLAALLLAGVVGSRGFFLGLAGGVAALVASLALAGRYERTRILQMGLGIAVLTTTAVGFLMLTPAGQRAGERVVEFAAEERLITYRVALDAAADRPLLGYGPDSFPVAYTSHRTTETGAFGIDIIENSAHNLLLQILVTTGAVGLGTFVLLLGAWTSVLRVLVQRQPLAGGAIAAGVGAYLGDALVSVSSNGVEWVLWVAVGSTVGLVAGSAGSTLRRARLQEVLLLALLGATAVISAGSVVPSLAASREALAASASFQRQHVQTAEAAALRAVSLDPGRSDHWNWLGLAYTLSQRWKDAADAFSEAAARSPYDSTFWQNLARARALQSLGGDQSSGGAEASLRAIDRAIQAEPIEPSTYELGTELALALGRPETALGLAVEGYRRARWLVSDDLVSRAARVLEDGAAARTHLEFLVTTRESAALRVALARAAIAMGDVEAARRNASRALELEPGNAEATEILARTGT